MSHTFDTQSYGSFVAEWLSGPGLQGLAPAKPARVNGKGPSLETIFAGKTIVDDDMARCCLSGLWLYRDHLHESHELSQEIETTTGSYWHAIIHRREPDAWNSKYWWQRVGLHPVLDLLREQAPTLGFRYTSPQDFVDFCEASRGAGSADEQLAQRVQKLEWELLFDWCYKMAISR